MLALNDSHVTAVSFSFVINTAVVTLITCQLSSSCSVSLLPFLAMTHSLLVELDEKAFLDQVDSNLEDGTEKQCCCKEFIEYEDNL